MTVTRPSPRVRRDAAALVGLASLLAPSAAQDEPAPGDDAEGRPYVVAPFVTASPGFGAGGGLMGMLFYRPDPADRESPTSSLMGLGTYSDTDSYAGGLFNKLYLDEDRLRVDLGLMTGRIRSDLSVGPLDDIEFDSNLFGVLLRAQRRVRETRWFVGATTSFVSIDYDSRNAAGDAYFEAFDVQDEDKGSVGAVASYDSRDDQRYPTRGVLAEASLVAHPEWLGVSEGYEVLELTGNRYRELRPDHVLALRAHGRFTPTDTPYAGLSRLGQRNDLRGYVPGEKVAENLIATQAEYRWMFAERFGVVGFGGVAGLYDGSLSNLDSDGVFWSGGVGLRYTLSAENRLNFRLDYAWGQDDESGFYIAMGESF